MRGDTHVRCGGRTGETDREQSRHRAPVRPTITGKGGKSQIATLVERSSRYVMLVRILYDRTAERVAALLAKKMQTLPDFLRNRGLQQIPGRGWWCTHQLTLPCPTRSFTQTLYLQAKGELRTELKLALRQVRAKRVPRSRASPGLCEEGKIPGKAANRRSRPPVERSSRFTMLVRIAYESLRRSRRRALGELNGRPCKTLNWRKPVEVF